MTEDGTSHSMDDGATNREQKIGARLVVTHITY
jgi:hypothetical protein